MKRIVFLSSSSFPRVTGGSILFNRLISSLPDFEFKWITLELFSKRNIAIASSDILSVGLLPIFKFSLVDKIFRKLSFLGRYWFKFKFEYLRNVGRNYLSNPFSGIDLFWIHLSGSIIPFAASFLKENSYRFHVSVQDDIFGHLPPWEASVLENDYRWLLTNASSVDFASDSLREYIFNKYNFCKRNSIICFSDEVLVSAPRIDITVGKIGFAGNVWCAENFNTLLKSIKILNDSDRNIKLYVFSNNFPKYLYDKYSSLIVNMDFLDSKSLVLELQKMDFLYVPMSFHVSKRILSVTSFPSKVFTYLNAGVPILFHAPEYSSVTCFSNSNSIGVTISTNIDVDFLKEFSVLMSLDQKSRISLAKGSISLLHDKYSFSIQRSEFIKLILD